VGENWAIEWTTERGSSGVLFSRDVAFTALARREKNNGVERIVSDDNNNQLERKKWRNDRS